MIAASQEAGPSVPRRGTGSDVNKSSIRKRATSTDFTQWSLARKYAVIVDAGSSGSRMQIYSWKDARVDRAQRERVGEKVKVLPSVEKGTWEGSGRDWQLKVEPGLSSFGSHPDDLDEYLSPLFKHASTIIPAAALADTPVYILATAGMRFLPDDQRKAVISKTCKFVEEKTAFSLRGGCAEHVQVITGEEEGLLGWIAINYLMDGFHFKSTTPVENSIDGTKGTKGKATYGFLDMGGASTQIAFEPSAQAKEKADSSDLTPITLRMLDGTDVKHNVFVTTFLGFGTNKARERYLDALAVKTKAKPMSDPCLPSGLQMVATNKTSLLGTGSFDTCLSSLSPLLDKGAKCDRPPCLFHGVHVPEIDFSVNHFIGVSEYWFSSNDVFKLGGVYDFVHFQKAAQKFCNRPWSELEAELDSKQVYGPQVSKDRLEMQCFKAAWMTTVLHEGIGLPRIVDSDGKGDGKPHANDAQSKADEKNLFQSVNDVNGLAVSWTLGKAVMEASKEIAPLPVVQETHEIAKKPVPPPAEIIEEHKSTSNDWTGISAPSWNSPSPAFLKGANAKIGGGALLAVVALTLVLICACCMLRGRGAKATKRRNTIKEIIKGPCMKKRPRGDYVLANMEEGGHDMETIAANNAAANKTAGQSDFVVSSDSGDEEVDYPKGSRHKLRRSSGNGLIATLFVPVQKLALAMGFDSTSILNPSSNTSSPSSSLAMSSRNRLISSKRKPNMPKLPFKRNFSTPMAAWSQPESPSLPPMSSHGIASATMGSAISRPGSRASTRMHSPRLYATVPSSGIGTPLGSAWSGNGSVVEASGGFFAQQAASAASARSSRAASPALGTSSNGRSSRNSNKSSLTRRAWEE